MLFAVARNPALLLVVVLAGLALFVSVAIWVSKDVHARVPEKNAVGFIVLILFLLPWSLVFWLALRPERRY